MKLFKSIVKDIATNEITLKTIIVLLYIAMAICIYKMIDLYFIF